MDDMLKSGIDWEPEMVSKLPQTCANIFDKIADSLGFLRRYPHNYKKDI